MTESEIISRVRRGLREPSPRLTSDTDITDMIDEAVRALALEFNLADRRYFTRTAAVSSDTHIFAYPADADSILRVWAMKESAQAVTAATGAGVTVVLTITAHGFTDGELVQVQDVAGNTAANGTWQVDGATTDTFELVGSTGNAAYTSGGLVFRVPKLAELLEVAHVEDTTLTDSYKWTSRGRNIVLDSDQFTFDLYVEYTPLVDTLTLADIPGLYHPGIAGFCVSELLTIPAQDDPAYADLAASQSRNSDVWNRALQTVRTHFRPAPQPSNPRDVMGWGLVY